MTVDVGDNAPYFGGLASYKGNKNIVLYFYPKDDTKSHENFKKKHNISFELISDENSELSIQYGAWVEKNMFGKSYMGIDRSTFLIDKNGKIRQIWRNVRVGGHVDKVLEMIREIM